MAAATTGGRGLAPGATSALAPRCVTAPDPGIMVRVQRPSTASRIVMGVCKGVVGPILRTMPINRMTVPVGAIAVDLLTRMRPEPGGIDAERIDAGTDFPMEVVRPAGAAKSLRSGAVLYLHGGGFAVGGLRSHRPIVAGIARRTGMPVLHVQYRQLPGAGITESVDDCVVAYRWLLQQGADPGRIVFAGDSAGGFLAFATALQARELGLPQPAGLIGLSPLLDLDYSAKAGYVNAGRDAYIPVSALEAVVRMGAEQDGPADPELSPVNADLAGLPPVLLIAAEDELLRYDSELMAHRLTAAGVPNKVELWRGQVHAFMSILPTMPESRSVLARVAEFVRTSVAAGEQETAKTA